MTGGGAPHPAAFTTDRRATRLLVSACALAEPRLALLPALYCADVAAAIEADGVRYRCYDFPDDLGVAESSIASALDRDVGVVVVLHPFGLERPLARGIVPRSVVVVEDAAHALRTSLHAASRIGAAGDVVVFSPRKELGWNEGGVATGPRSVELARVAPEDEIAARWRALDFELLAQRGRQATELARQALGERLPPLESNEVLSALPLRSARRDPVIARLRRRGVPAWRWLRPLKTTGPRLTPRAHALREQLFLVPTADGPEMARRLDLLQRETLLPWSERCAS